MASSGHHGAGAGLACQVCGRRPAKLVTFKAHCGFVVFRQELEISGCFCRDHALEAHAAAQGANLINAVGLRIRTVGGGVPNRLATISGTAAG